MSTTAEKIAGIAYSLAVLRKRLARLQESAKTTPLTPMQEVEVKKLHTAIGLGEALLNGVQ